MKHVILTNYAKLKLRFDRCVGEFHRYKCYTIYSDYENFNNNFSKINFNSVWYVIFESNLVFRKC